MNASVVDECRGWASFARRRRRRRRSEDDDQLNYLPRPRRAACSRARVCGTDTTPTPRHRGVVNDGT